MEGGGGRGSAADDGRTNAKQMLCLGFLLLREVSPSTPSNLIEEGWRRGFGLWLRTHPVPASRLVCHGI